MDDSDTIFNLVFGWGMVVLALLLFVILLMYIRSLLVFKNAEIIKGKVIDTINIGALDLPTIEYQLNGEILQFRSKTAIKTLAEGQELDLQIGSAIGGINEPRILDKNSPKKLPKVIYVIFILMLFLGFKGFAFLQSLMML